ncbi:hypothetical protein ACFE04_023326 [Oxalis oulophora]
MASSLLSSSPSSSTRTTSPTNPHFFKIILASTIEQGKIAIPEVFVQNYGDHLSNPVFLEDPFGEIWKLKLTDHNGILWLEDGWKEFVDYYSLACGQLVCFRSEGNSIFKVVIYGKNTYEISYPHPDPACCDESDETVSDNPGVRRNLNRKKKKNNTRNPRTRSKKTNASTTASSSRVPQNTPNRGEFGRQMLPETVQPKVTRKMSKLLKIGASEALNKAQGFKSENPSFRLIMSKTYIEQPKQVCVPLPFAEEYFPGTEGDITLQVDGDTKTWSLKYKVYTEQRRCQISNGWRRFVNDNKLQLNDLCVFELINKDPLTLKISIFRETELGKSPAGEQRFEDLFKSDFPFFHVVITSANLQEENMEIPKAFTEEHIRINIHNVKLKVGEIIWPMKLGTSEGRVRQFSGGWIEFAKVNELRAGDICVFELISKCPCKLFKMSRLR